MGLVTAIKGLGKAYIAHKKTKKADKLYQSQRTDKYSGNVTDPDTIKLNKQLKTPAKCSCVGLSFVLKPNSSIRSKDKPYPRS